MSRFYSNDWGADGKPKAELKKESLLRIYRYFAPYGKLMAAVLLCISASSGLGVLQPLLIKWVVDTAIPEGRTGLLNLLVLGMLLAAIVQGLIGVAQAYLNSRIGQGVMFDIRNQMYKHLHRMSIRFFTSTKTGDIMSRVNNDVNGLQQVVTDTLSNSMNNLLISVTTLITMFAMDWRLALLSLVLLPLFILPTRRVGQMNYRSRKQTQAKVGELSSLMQETLSVSGALLVKAFVRQEEELERFRQVNGDLMRLQIRQSMIGRWFFMFLSIITTAGPAVIYWYGGHLVIDQSITLGTVIAFTAFLTRLYGPVAALANIQVNILGSVALFDRLFEYLDMPIEIEEREHPVQLGDVQGRIEFDHVSFRYQDERDVLRDVSFVMEPGQLVALVGPSGSGKTTVSNLIPRFYDPTDGRVLLDGHDLRDVGLRSLGEQIGMVTQETFLFHATIRDNLRNGKPDATDEELWHALRVAQAEGFVREMSGQLEAHISQGGTNVSGGQRQRLAIARALVKRPRIFVFDDSFSALDVATDARLRAALQRETAGAAVIIVGQRVATIADADKILVMEHGEIVGSGTHEELLAHCPTYAEIVDSQLSAVEAAA